jgi:hypothetical protein
VTNNMPTPVYMTGSLIRRLSGAAMKPATTTAPDTLAPTIDSAFAVRGFLRSADAVAHVRTINNGTRTRRMAGITTDRRDAVAQTG